MNPWRARRGLALLAAALCAATALAQHTPAFEITEARTEAAGFAITHDLLVRNLVHNCNPFSGSLSPTPEEALAGWRQRNAERLDAARGYMIYARTAIERRLGTVQAEDFYRKITGEFAQQAKNMLQDIFSRAGPQPGVCGRWVAAIANREADLDGQPKYLPALDEILAFHKSVLAGAR